MPIIEIATSQKKMIDKINFINIFLLLIKIKIKNGIKDTKIKKPLSNPQKKAKTLIKLINNKYLNLLVFKNFNIKIKKINKGISRHQRTASFKIYKILIAQNIKKYALILSSAIWFDNSKIK